MSYVHLYRPVSISDTSDAAVISVILDMRWINNREGCGRPIINVFIDAGIACDFVIAGSIDGGTTWRAIETVTFAAPGNAFKAYANNAYPMIKVSTATAGDHMVDIIGAR